MEFNRLLIEMAQKQKFEVIVSGEVERETDLIGLFKLLLDFGGAINWSEEDIKIYMNESFEDGYFYIDANITCRMI
jgi:hypothetical protein